MKRILIIHDSMGGGGAERVLVTLLQGLDPEKYDITLLLIYGEGPFMDSIPGYVKVKSLFSSYRSKATRLITHFYRVRNIIREKLARRKLAGEHFDIVVSFMEGPAAKLHSQLIDLAPRNLSWIHSNQLTGRWYNFWFREDEESEFYRKMDKVAFVSNELKDAFATIFSTNADKIVIYNPINAEYLSRKASQAEIDEKDCGTFTVVNSGRLIDIKNHSLLIKVAGILKGHGRRFKVNILGDGPLRNQLEQEINDTGLGGNVTLQGFKDNPFPYIKNADVFCMTSKSEGFPMVVIESLALGTPVVSTPIASVGEALSEGSGIITDGTPEGIATAIESLMDSPSQLKAMKKEACENSARFELSAIIPLVEKFLLH